MIAVMKTATVTSALSIAINGQLPLEAAPEWIQLLPAGPTIVGRDGRNWVLPEPAALIEAHRRLGRSLVIDWEHGSERKSPAGERAPAAGHIEELEARPDGVWGRVVWTPQGAEDVRTGAYRYISPVFLHDKATRRIVELRGAGLVHEPNLPLAALNKADPSRLGVKSMDLSQVYAALDLVDGANEDQILAAVTKLKADKEKALNRAENPDLARFVPRADYDQALERATNAEATLKQLQDQARDAEIEAVIDAALKDGKIVPASVDYYRAQCRREGGLDEFKNFVSSAPKIVAPSNLDGKPAAPEGAATALNDEERAVIRQLGITEEAYLKTKGSN